MKLPYYFFLTVFMVFWSVSMTAQSHKLPEPQMAVSTMAAPPPPGLPIDEHGYLLFITGLGLGIYLIRLRKTV